MKLKVVFSGIAAAAALLATGAAQATLFTLPVFCPPVVSYVPKPPVVVVVCPPLVKPVPKPVSKC